MAADRRKPSGWVDVVLGVKNEVRRDNLSIVAAGVAFYGFLALVPGLAALVSLYGLVADANDVQRQLDHLAAFLPGEALSTLETQLDRLVAASPRSLTAGAVGSIAVSLWSATKGSRAIMKALNIVYDRESRRGFLRRQGLALAITVTGVLAAIVVLALLVALPLLAGWIGFGGWERVAALLRWPPLLAVALFGLSALYRFVPDRLGGRTRWLSAGAILATLLWWAASWLFSLYVARAANFAATLGSLGAVAVLLLWLYISAFVLLLGGELNCVLERPAKAHS